MRVVKGTNSAVAEPEDEETTTAPAELALEPVDSAPLIDEEGASYDERRLARFQARVTQLSAQIDEPLDKALVKQRKGYGEAKLLDYLEWHTVVRQLNRIFGKDGWTTEVKNVQVFGTSPEGVPGAVAAQVQLTVRWAPNLYGKESYFENVGVESVKPSNGKLTWAGFEMAYMGAVHTALKRCAVNLGEQFGLSLYVKEEQAREAKASQFGTTEAKETASTTSAAKSTASAAPAEQGDDVAFCEDCNGEIRGYTHRTSGRVYTTQDLVDISKRNANGRVLCYNCRQKGR